MTQAQPSSNADRRAKPRWLQTRGIAQRIVVTGELVLLTPTRFGGGGQTTSLTDMPLLLDPITNKPLLPGTSIAGAMRAYLREWIMGYEEPTQENSGSLPQLLFGEVVANVPPPQRKSVESYLVVEDAYAQTLKTEIRPGVKINPKTRTVKMEKKGGQLFDMELLQAGTTFPLRIELALPEDEAKQVSLKQALAVALTGFERGEIGLGARKRRGFGECKVTSWAVETFDLKQPDGLIGWLKGDSSQTPASGGNIADLLKVSLPDDKRVRFRMVARFQLKTSLLIRSGGDDADSPDMTHLSSHRNGKQKAVPILSGTSLAGAVRARAQRIANTVNPEQAAALITDLFGTEIMEGQAQRGDVKASRAIFYEREVRGRNDLVQTRIRIDRFTGGTYPGALFEQQPVFGGPNSEVRVEIELHKPDDAQIGLLLHVLKDLWTGDLPLGGEASVGRGRMRGIEATLSLHKDGTEKNWKISQRDKENLDIEGDRKKLEVYAQAVAGGAK